MSRKEQQRRVLSEAERVRFGLIQPPLNIDRSVFKKTKEEKQLIKKLKKQNKTN